MNNLVFVIHKKHKWIVEPKNGSIMEKREHTSRRQGIISLFQRHTGVDLFHLVIPTDGIHESQDFFFRKSDSKKWRFNGKEYDSRIKAINGFLHCHPKLFLFYISIPIDKA